MILKKRILVSTLFLSSFNGTRIFVTNIEKYSNIEIHENPSIQCETSGQMDGRTGGGGVCQA